MALLGGRSDINLQECWGVLGLKDAAGTCGPRNCDGQPEGGPGDTPGYEGEAHTGVSSPGEEGSTPRPLGLGPRLPGGAARLQEQGGAPSLTAERAELGCKFAQAQPRVMSGQP